jgi:hypothetical protein
MRIQMLCRSEQQSYFGRLMFVMYHIRIKCRLLPLTILEDIKVNQQSYFGRLMIKIDLV